MAQVKKEAVRRKIIQSATEVFERVSYVGATVGQIAANADQSVANIYNYFPSKLHIAFAVFEPWIAARLDRIEAEARRIRDPRARLAYALSGLWREIPKEQNNFFNNFIQAIAAATPKDGYTPTILIHTRERIRRIIIDCLPPERRKTFDAWSFAHLTAMTFDGFVINGHLDPNSACTDQIIETACNAILGEALRSSGRSSTRRETTRARSTNHRLA